MKIYEKLKCQLSWVMWVSKYPKQKETIALYDNKRFFVLNLVRFLWPKKSAEGDEWVEMVKQKKNLFFFLIFELNLHFKGLCCSISLILHEFVKGKGEKVKARWKARRRCGTSWKFTQVFGCFENILAILIFCCPNFINRDFFSRFRNLFVNVLQT